MSETGAIEAFDGGDGPGDGRGAGGLRVRFRLPRSAYLAVLFLLFGVSAVIVTAWLVLLYLLPLLVALFIARRGTDVDARGVTVRALLASRTFPWDRVSGLSVDDRGRVRLALGRPVEALVRLPCVGVSGLPVLAEASGGRVPALPPAVVKAAPGRRRR